MFFLWVEKNLYVYNICKLNFSTERSLGPLLKLDIWHDNQGDSPSWYLKTICIKDLNVGE